MFFFRLPEDVQKCVLQTWIGAFDDAGVLLKASSALDIACTSKAQRPSYLLLVQWLSFDSSQKTQIAWLTNYCNWVRDRQAAVKSIVFFSEPLLDLDECQQPILSVEEIVTGPESSTPRGLAEVLARCPNLTAFTCDSRWSIGDAAVVRETHGHQLVELRMNNADIDSDELAKIVSTCPRLQTLGASELNVSVADVALLFEGCPDLMEISARHMYYLESNFNRFLAVCKHRLRRFSMEPQTGFRSELFADMLEQLDHAEHINLGTFIYSRQDSSLKVHIGVSDSTLKRIFERCSRSVANLEVFSNMMRENSVAAEQLDLIKKYFHGRLESLKLSGTKVKDLITLCCPPLKRLHLTGVVSATLLKTAVTICKDLQALTVISWNYDVDDEAMEVVFANCPNLTSLQVTGARSVAGRRSLTAILDNRLHLISMCWKITHLSKDDVEWFRQQCKERGLLPVPQIECQ